MNHVSSLHAVPPQNSRVIEFVAEELKTNDSDLAKFYTMKLLKAKMIRQFRNGSLYIAKAAFTNPIKEVASLHQNTGSEEIWTAIYAVLLLSLSLNVAMFCYAFHKILTM
ncbi:unnamed protein product [Larinioides sclopetarius]|uniref:Uncharacterized protein n=1 Tax=Larinioides sclopetarius TaxID=280406 RepID=A0AAV2BM37_9ARAC